MPTFDSRDFSFVKLATEERQNKRKDETDAIVPYLPEIRATARFRWSQMKRLRDAFYKAIEDVQKHSTQLPLKSYYDEPERIGERLYFRLWDKPSFVSYNQDQFTEMVIKVANDRKGTYSDDNNHFFVEYIKAKRLDGDDEEEMKQKRTLLNTWGYGEEDSEKNPLPFCSWHKGILSQSIFVSLHRNKAEGVLLDLETFYAACTFGLLAIDVFTTTGARLNKLLQINSSKSCIQVKKVKEKLHYSFRVIPKGRDEVEEFYISKQTMEYIQIVLRMLKDHYRSDKIPSVEYRFHRNICFQNRNRIISSTK